MEIPFSTDRADAAFVTEALRSSGAIDSATAVEEVEHEPIGVGVGIVGQLARLHLRYRGRAGHAPGSVVIKLPSQFPENRAVGDHFRFYEREGRFYQHISGKLPVRVPLCYWNHVDPATGTFGLLLEDLTGWTAISQLAGVDPERARQALTALAGLHGTWWDSPGLDGLEWMPRLDDPVNLAAGEQYRLAWPLFLERLGSRVPAGSDLLGERVQAVFEELLRSGMGDAPTTICHGDFRVDNLLFQDGPSEHEAVAVLDWQISYRGPAVSDVAYFLCQSLEPEVRHRHEEDLVRHWYRTVASERTGRGAEEIDAYPFEMAWEQYRRSVLATTVYAVTAAGAMDPANERGRELVEAMAVRSFSAALDLRSEELLP